MTVPPGATTGSPCGPAQPAVEAAPCDLAAALVLIEQLRQALQTNRVIGIATGMLAERAHLTPAQALAELTSLSQHHNVKLRHIATMFIEGTDAPARCPATGTDTEP